MTRDRRELETLFLTAFAAVPLYLTGVVSLIPLLAFHAVMFGIIVRVALGKGPELIPAPLMRAIAAAYIVFYGIDAIMISRSAIAASTHLVLFIAAYQPIESLRTPNQAQRLLTTTLIFIASIATATHISIVLFVAVFAWLLFRQLMYVSHLESMRSLGRTQADRAAGGTAFFYLLGTIVIAALLFPVMPRVRNPLVQGLAANSSNTATGLSETIDFNQQRTISNDPAVVARVWMGADTSPFFTPLRLRGAVYDRFEHNEWRTSRRFPHPLPLSRNGYQLAKPSGFKRSVSMQQRLDTNGRLYLPVGAYSVSSPAQVSESRDAWTVNQQRGLITLDVGLARRISPLRETTVGVGNYPVTPEVSAMARRIVGVESDPLNQAAAIERYLSTTFHYIADPSTIGHRMSVDDFLLKDHRGHCEYFAAGMVALMTSLNVPARIAGGFYGGKFNPLTGYIAIRREDAHAWVEVWDGQRWETFDPTPASLRPGSGASGGLSAYASAVSDSINYFWDRYVLTYGLSDQVALFIQAIGSVRTAIASAKHATAEGLREVTSTRYMLAMTAVLAAAALLWWLGRRRRPPFELLAEELRRFGVVVGPSMTVAEALLLLRREHPDAAEALAPLIELYERESFSPHSDAERRAEIRRGLAELRG
jgi:transglutaminase-like putative cysteine protease